MVIPFIVSKLLFRIYLTLWWRIFLRYTSNVEFNWCHSLKSRKKLALILESLRDRIATPSDIIAQTGLPRYEVLASFHILEALGIVSIVYSRGNYKLYSLTDIGRELLEVLNSGKEFRLRVLPIEHASQEEGVAQVPEASESEVIEAVT